MKSIQLDLTKTALVLIDLQQGIMGMPLEPRSSADVLRNAVKLADRFREAQATVVLVNVNFSASGADTLKTETDLKMSRPAPPANWAEIVPELGPRPNDILVTKRQWGAFYGTELDLQLRRRGITTIVLGGVATNMGVESTARPAHELGYQLILVEDAMSSRSTEMHEFAVGKIFPLLGHVRSTEEVLTACGATQS
jgi:nicotinamidase-related amidase